MKSIVNLKTVILLTTMFLISCVPSANLKLAQQAMTDGDLVNAHTYYMAVLKETPNNAEAKAALENIRDQLTAKTKREADALVRSTPKMTVPSLRSAILLLDQAAVYDPQGTRLGPQRTQYQQFIAQIKKQNAVLYKAQVYQKV